MSTASDMVVLERAVPSFADRTGPFFERAGPDEFDPGRGLVALFLGLNV
jgi:hypothetical protein